MSPLRRLLTAAEGTGARINREPSRTLARVVPWASVIVGSVAATVLWIASAPLLPPFGLLVLIAWFQLRPSLLPVWAGLPLGIVDDLLSGQPMGSAVLLWSLSILALEAIEARIPWRIFVFDWLVAALLIAAAIALGALIPNPAAGIAPLLLIGPQIALSVLAYPAIARFVAALDRFRLLPFVEVNEWD
jgi:rod shape-determining protein MreD